MSDVPPRHLSRRVVVTGLGAAAAAAAFKPTPAYAQDAAPATEAVFSSRGADVSGVVAIEEDGASGIQSHSGSSGWSESAPMRLRMSRATPDHAGAQHFFVIPYQYGFALEYNGVVECWVNEWSIHNNGQGGDPNGARLWVGNHDDSGGLHLTAHRFDGTKWASVTSELFSRESGGDLRFVVRDVADGFEFRSGPRGGERSYLRITANGQIFARMGQTEQVYVGAAGPAKQAGVAFGRASDVRVYRKSGSMLATDARFIAGGGLGVGNAVPADRVGQLVGKTDVYDANGNRLGYIPIYEDR